MFLLFPSTGFLSLLSFTLLFLVEFSRRQLLQIFVFSLSVFYQLMFLSSHNPQPFSLAELSTFLLSFLLLLIEISKLNNFYVINIVILFFKVLKLAFNPFYLLLVQPQVLL